MNGRVTSSRRRWLPLLNEVTRAQRAAAGTHCCPSVHAGRWSERAGEGEVCVELAAGGGRAGGLSN